MTRTGDFSGVVLWTYRCDQLYYTMLRLSKKVSGASLLYAPPPYYSPVKIKTNITCCLHCNNNKKSACCLHHKTKISTLPALKKIQPASCTHCCSICIALCIELTHKMIRDPAVVTRENILQDRKSPQGNGYPTVLATTDKIILVTKKA